MMNPNKTVEGEKVIWTSNEWYIIELAETDLSEYLYSYYIECGA